jgi:glycosyltransferase involved in cell wall biosynthesis
VLRREGVTEVLPLVSVIIPTYNRSRLLKQTVDTFLAQDYPADRWELILVDNGSTDDTRDVIRKLEVEHSGIRAMTEPRKGAHFARNSGALAATGEILYFTDDDMLAEPNMLSEIVQGFDTDRQVASVTGKVLPKWDTEPPVWVLEHCRNALLSLLDLGEATIVSDEDPGVFSCHQAVRKEVFMSAGGFNPDTNADVFTGDNETGLNIKIKQLGFRFAYVGAAVTHHIIPASRMTQTYLNGRMADQGFCDSYTQFRALRPGKGRLARRMLAHSVLGGLTVLKAAAHRAAGDSAWHLDLARLFYFRNRIRYDARLVSQERWREFALRDDWLSEGGAVNAAH